MKWTWHRLWDSLRDLAEKEDIDSAQGAFGDPVSVDKLGRSRVCTKSTSECVMHEVLHAYLLGLNVCSSTDVGKAIYPLSYVAADHNELQVLAAELVVADRLSLRIEPKRLVEYAYGNLNNVPKYQAPDASLKIVVAKVIKMKNTKKVVKAANKFLKLVGARDMVVA